MFSCTCGSPDTALSIVDVGAMSVELRHDLGSSRSLRSGALLESTQVLYCLTFLKITSNLAGYYKDWLPW